MRVRSHHRRPDCGATLVEAVLAIGVLAVAIPLALGAMSEAGNHTSSARAETRSVCIVNACIEEVRAIRHGCSPYFDAVPAGEPFPGDGGLFALGFSTEGRLVGKISRTGYDRGLRKPEVPGVHYIATLEATRQAAVGNPQSLKLRITIEYPASAPAGKRRKIDFRSRTP